MSDSGTSGPGTPRTAILASTDASSSALASAASAHHASTIRHTSGSLDTQAAATRLAAEGYDTIIGIGAEARAAVAQADAGEVGKDGTSWRVEAAGGREAVCRTSPKTTRVASTASLADEAA